MPIAKGSVCLPNQMGRVSFSQGSSNSNTVENSDPENKKDFCIEDAKVLMLRSWIEL
jgi:hypothetical protein